MKKVKYEPLKMGKKLSEKDMKIYKEKVKLRNIVPIKRIINDEIVTQLFNKDKNEYLEEYVSKEKLSRKNQIHIKNENLDLSKQKIKELEEKNSKILEKKEKDLENTYAKLLQQKIKELEEKNSQILEKKEKELEEKNSKVLEDKPKEEDKKIEKGDK